VALPTATKHHPKSLQFTLDQLREIDSQIIALRGKVRNAIITTVGLSNRKGLNAQIEDVIFGSVAHLAGITHGSIIRTINGKSPRSRTEASSILLNQHSGTSKEPLVVCVVDKDGKEHEVDLDRHISNKGSRLVGEKEVGTFGLLLHDDVDFGIFSKIKEAQENFDLQSPIMITSEIMHPFFMESLSRLHKDEKIQNLKIIKAKNHFFGGNVNVAGLLTFQDLLLAIKNSGYSKFDGVFIPAAMLSRGGFDLIGRHYNEFASQINAPVFPIKSNTGSI
jgi:hypothetical protein